MIGLDDGLFAAAVADGVGSCRFAREASSIAMSAFRQVMEESSLDASDERGLLSALKNAFKAAKESIERYSEDNRLPVSEFETTLTALIYDGHSIYYGHSGDGGIIALLDTGEYVSITRVQKGLDGESVITLSQDEHWFFGSYRNVASVLLATDGVYNIFYPFYLKKTPVKLYIPLISSFLDNNQLSISSENEKDVEDTFKQYLLSDDCSVITDDMTVVALINTDAKTQLMPPEYYMEPDWDRLEQEYYDYIRTGCSGVCIDSPDGGATAEPCPGKDFPDNQAYENAKRKSKSRVRKKVKNKKKRKDRRKL